MADPSNTPHVNQGKISMANDQAQTCGDRKARQRGWSRIHLWQIKYYCHKHDLCWKCTGKTQRTIQEVSYITMKTAAMDKANDSLTPFFLFLFSHSTKSSTKACRGHLWPSFPLIAPQEMRNAYNSFPSAWAIATDMSVECSIKKCSDGQIWICNSWIHGTAIKQLIIPMGLQDGTTTITSYKSLQLRLKNNKSLLRNLCNSKSRHWKQWAW